MSANANRARLTHALLEDQSLILESQVECWPLVRAWLPLNCEAAASTARPRATLAVEIARSNAGPRSSGKGTLRVGSVRAHVDEHAARVRLVGAAECWGWVDLDGLHASLQVPPGGPEAVAADVYSMLTIASALLLGRSGRGLIHAGAIVAPERNAWLIVGDARSGKSTTCASLAITGCELLSDDQVVLTRSEEGVAVEGWLRPLHLDEGWPDGVPRGRRRTVHPAELTGEPRSRSVQLAGALFTSVVAAERTSVSVISAADAFTGMVRQSPWLMADRRAAESVVETLSSVARLSAYAVQLGLDTFSQPDRLRAVLDPVIG